MRRIFLFFLILHSLSLGSQAQSPAVQQLKSRLEEFRRVPGYQTDTGYLNTVNRLSFYYADNYPDSAIALLYQNLKNFIAAGYDPGLTNAYNNYGLAYYTKGDYQKANEYYEQALALAEKKKIETLLPKVLNNMGISAMATGNYTLALRYYYRSLAAAEKVNDQFSLGRAYNNIAIVNFYQGRMDEAELYYKKLLSIAQATHDVDGIILSNNNIGEVYLERKQFPQALSYFNNAFKAAVAVNKSRYIVSCNKNLGLVYLKMDSLPLAAFYFSEAYKKALSIGNKPSACIALIGLANTEYRQKQMEEALKSGQEAVRMAEAMGNVQMLRDANEVLANVYESRGDGLKALNHYRFFKQYSDSLRNIEAERTSERLKAEFDFSRKELEFQRKNLQQRWLIFSALAALLTALLVILLVYRSRQKEKKVNKLLQEKNSDIEHQKSIAEEALIQLRVTQKQLIQNEKMASLGELTAGIAHEIQNPLNFVNNFSEVSAELLSEMVEEVEKGNIQTAKSIADDVVLNLEKINYHGKRAADIVKGMLQHSRSSSGVKEPTDLNALCDEYLRLAYHGFRAKEKSFNVHFETSFDPGVGTVNVVAQDIGRVLLNLVMNAFYAVNDQSASAGKDYIPTVIVRTRKSGDHIEISVADNGTGIPPEIKDKIFQPFFTTKPAGQGTGLGLSMSYDIITKAHNGTLKVETKEKGGSTFIINLPALQV